MKEGVRIGILGSGFMGQTYARTIANHVTGATLTAVAGGSRAAGLAAEYGVAALESVEALAGCAEVDMVCIATPHAGHGREGLLLAQAGKHLLIDKPMATSATACDAILEVCRAQALNCEIMFTQRHRVCNMEMKRLVESGALGRVLHVHNVQVVPGGMESTPAWQLRPENIGILMGHGIHNLDQIRWLTGQEVDRVFAKVRALDPRYEVDGTADVVLTLQNGLVCTVFCTFEMPKPGIPRMGGATRVIGEGGIIDCDWYGELRVSRDGGPWEVAATQPFIDWAGKGFLDPVRLETYAVSIQSLVDAIRAGRPGPGTGWDGRQAVAIAEAAYASSRTGQEIALG